MKPRHIVTEHLPSQIHRREALLNCGSLVLTVFCVVDVEQQTPQLSSQKKKNKKIKLLDRLDSSSVG